MPIGRGPFHSLRRRVMAEIAELQQRNPELRRARYSWAKRVLKALLGNRSVGTMFGAYVVVAILLVGAQAAVAYWKPALLRTAGSGALDGLRDIGSYLLGGQLTVLGVVSVAVSIVTLLAQRTEGASARSETRLYYVEALAYELVTSGIALSLVLAVQLFWPLQTGLEALGLGGDGVLSQTSLTVIHALWLMGNLGLFFHFMMTTLRFVEPNARAALRERYSANAIIPGDLEKRLIEVLHAGIGRSILEDAEATPGPILTMWHSRATNRDAVTEVARTFRRPMMLVDVWERPLASALRSWTARVRKTPAQPRPFEARPGWADRLAIAVSPGSRLHGTRDLVVRTGGTPLTWWERFEIRLSLRFAPVPAQADDRPTPHEMVEELVDQVVGQIDRAAVTGFKAALSEAVRFHRFLLAAQHHTGSDGQVFNFAAIGSLLRRPNEGWVGEYQRLYDAAAARMGEDASFIDKLGYLPHRLMPDDVANSAPDVVADLLTLGIYEALALQKWIQAHATPVDPTGPPSLTPRTLTGVNRDTYQRVVVKFVGAWETLVSGLGSRFNLDDAVGLDADANWEAHGRAWRFVHTHLWATVTMLGVAVRSEDELGAGWLRDVLLRWPERLDRDDTFARLQRRPLLRADWLRRPFDEASAYARRLAQAPAVAVVRPQDLFSVILRSAHADAVVLTAAAALSWHLRRTDGPTLAGETARRLLHREVLPEGGRPLRPSGQTGFRDVFLLILRTRFGLGPAEQGSVTEVDKNVRQLLGLREAPIVPGRVYTGWGPTGAESLDFELVAILAALAPPTGDAGVVALVAELGADEAFFLRGDESIQGAISTLESFAHRLGPAFVMPEFARAVLALAPGADPSACRTRAAEIIDAALDALRQARLTRLLASPIDPDRVADFAAGLQARLAAADLKLAPLRAPAVELDVGVAAHRTFPLGNVERGLFTFPPRAAVDVDNMVEVTAEHLRDHLTGLVRAANWRRAKHTVRLKASRYPTNFWRAVARQKADIPDPVLVVPHGPTGQLVAGWVWGFGPPKPSGLQVEKREGEDGDGANYEAHIDGLAVYAANLPADTALLFSRAALKRLRVSPHGAAGHWLGLNVGEEAGSDRVTLEMRVGLETEWDDSLLVVFRIQGLTEDAADA